MGLPWEEPEMDRLERLVAFFIACISVYTRVLTHFTHRQLRVTYIRVFLFLG